MAARLTSTSSYRPWSPVELTTLRALYPAAERTAIEAALPGRAWGAIQDAGYRHRIGRDVYWSPADLVRLHADYPTRGAKALALELGCPIGAVRAKASKEGLRYVPQGRRTPRKPRKAAPKPAPKAAAPKPAPKPKAAPVTPLLSVKRSAGTPNLNLQKEARKQKEEAPKKAMPITAEEVRKRVPMYSAEWWAYTNGGVRGWQEWKGQQSAA